MKQGCDIVVFAVLMFAEQADVVVSDLLRNGYTVAPHTGHGKDNDETITSTEEKDGCVAVQMCIKVSHSKKDAPTVVTAIEEAVGRVKHYGAYMHCDSTSHRLCSNIIVERLGPIVPAGPYRTPS